MTKPNETQPASGINESPDALFEWIENPEVSAKPVAHTSLTSPLRTLKTIIWSLDWEISDQILTMLDEELNQLKQYYQKDKTVLKFLQLMEAVGKYIAKRKGKSHPESANLLRGLFVDLELIVFAMGLSEGERKVILRKQMEKFHALKKKLAASRTGEEPGKNPAPGKIPPVVKTPPKIIPPEVKIPSEVKISSTDTETQVEPEFNPGVFRQMLLDEMRLVIRYEFKKIKTELVAMINNQRSGK